MTTLIGGLDEVGWGSLAGPIVSVVTVFRAEDLNRMPKGVKDSKQCSELQRAGLYGPIHQLAWAIGIGHAWPWEIDQYGPFPSLQLSYRRALEEVRSFNPLDGENCFLTPTLNTCVIPAPSNTLFDRVWPRGGTFSNSSGPLPISLSFTLGCAPDSLRGFSNTRCRRKTSKFPFNNTELRACSSSQNASSPLRPLPNAVVGEHRISLSITLDFNS